MSASAATPLLFKRTPSIFLFPTIPILNWATVLISTLIVLDVATEIADYHDSISRSPHYNCRSSNSNCSKNDTVEKQHQQQQQKQKQRKACEVVNIAAIQVVIVSLLLIYISTTIVSRYTQHGVDTRMVYVLEGISRLESSHLMAYISTKTPRWIGVYHSPSIVVERRLKHVAGVEGGGVEQDEFRALQFHVRYTIAQYFLLVWCLCLPFSSGGERGGGHFISSSLLGFILGLSIESIILYARRGDDSGERKFFVATWTALLFAFLASVMFADGCHYIQVVWGSGLLFSEWGLGIATFSSSLVVILFTHVYHLQRTIRKYYVDRRISTHEKRMDASAITLIESHLRKASIMGSLVLTEAQRTMLIEEMAHLDTISENCASDSTPATSSSPSSSTDIAFSTPKTTTTMWSLLKMRLFSPTDLAAYTRLEYYLGIFISIASLFVVIVNIGATNQVNIVRQNFHKVHETLYESINVGPVCAWEGDVGSGKISTFASKDEALAAGYTIAHCGACGQCSSWQDLRLQYTTRSYLAQESFRCAKKSLIYGRDAVHRCLEEEPIGFSSDCAEW